MFTHSLVELSAFFCRSREARSKDHPRALPREGHLFTSMPRIPGCIYLHWGTVELEVKSTLSLSPGPTLRKGHTVRHLRRPESVLLMVHGDMLRKCLSPTGVLKKRITGQGPSVLYTLSLLDVMLATSFSIIRGISRVSESGTINTSLTTANIISNAMFLLTALNFSSQPTGVVYATKLGSLSVWPRPPHSLSDTRGTSSKRFCVILITRRNRRQSQGLCPVAAVMFPICIFE
ncbi:hypothetical protein BV22DRAFT_803017 [Leucogyrophana mollusca]|uniref:Uncharacterized protein n=1 Tax=Leucogyrophana mollusca TaxID=85980 RepID=A0ACB8B3R1_9AGAM|nr:hypothetical protein BV22DRAFT_803017 [Leucogyrophana mollusca]